MKTTLFIQKKILTGIICLCFFLCISTGFSAEILTETENSIIEKTLDFKLNLRALSTPDEAICEIDKYYSYIMTPDIQECVSDEVKLILDNMLVWEKYNYIYDKEIKSPLLEPLITSQYEKVKNWFSSNPKATHNKWLYCTAGDILSSTMQFLPVATAMKEGVTVKKYYDSALKQDPTMPVCLMNIGQWYFFAPAIAGGGKKKALEAFSKAVETAQNNYERYYATIYKSQLLQETNEPTEALSLLQDADTVLPGTNYISSIMEMNNQGYSLYYYILNREKIETE